MSTFIDLLRQYRHELEVQYGSRFSNDIRRAITAMLQCKTEKQGLSQWYCSHCHHHDRLALSCGNRHCPQCQHRTTSDWLDRQQQKLLPVQYYMVTFTLPYELRSLARSHPKPLYQAMFSVALKRFKRLRKKAAQKGSAKGSWGLPWFSIPIAGNATFILISMLSLQEDNTTQKDINGIKSRSVTCSMPSHWPRSGGPGCWK